MTTKVLYISYDGMTDSLGQSQVLPYLVGLSKNNIQITLLSCEKKERYNQNKALIDSICKENDIKWVPISYTKKPPVLSTFRDFLNLKAKAKKLHAQQSFHIVHCRSYVSALVGLKMKKKYALKFIFDMRGFWADERVDGNLWNTKKIVYKLIYNYFKQKERQFLMSADKVVSLTYAGKKEMLQWGVANLMQENIVVIPCATDYSLFEIQSQIKKNEAKKRLGISENQFVLFYLGSLGTWYLLDKMLQFFSVLKQVMPNAKFLFLTAEKSCYVFEKGKAFGLNEDDFIIKFAQRNEIPQYAHAADYGVFFIKPSFSKIASSPTKMGELLAMGIPIVCNNVGDIKEIVDKENVGFCITELSDNNFKDIVQQISDVTFQSSDLRKNTRKYYDLEKALKLYLSVYL